MTHPCLDPPLELFGALLWLFLGAGTGWGLLLLEPGEKDDTSAPCIRSLSFTIVHDALQ